MELFRIEKIVNGIFDVSGYRNLLMYSGPGTGKTSMSQKICDEAEGHGYTTFFVDAGTSFGKDDVIQHLDRITIFPKTITVFDEGITLSREATYALRTATNENSNHIFIINTNEISKINDVLKDRFMLLDCSIPNTEEVGLELWEWINKYKPEFAKKFESDYHFLDYFQTNFNGSLRSFFNNNSKQHVETKDLNTMINNMPPAEIQQKCFQTWFYKSGDYDKLKEFTDMCWKCDSSNFKTAFLMQMLMWEQKLVK